MDFCDICGRKYKQADSVSDNKMKKIVVFVGIIFAIVEGADLFIGSVSKDAILNVRDVGVNQTNTVQALFKRKADVLILGPSTANHHFDCRIMEDSLKMSCYNAGRDGQNIIFYDMVLEGFLSRCTPKLVVVDLTQSSLSDEWMTSLTDFNCYYGILEPVDHVLDSIATPIERIKRISNLYKYNKTWEWLLNARISKEVAGLHGYRPMPVRTDNMFKANESNVRFVMNQVCAHYLNRIISLCSENKIKLVFTSSPSLVIDKGNFTTMISAYLQRKGVAYWSWNGDTAYTHHPEFFYDMTHLNADGSTKFTCQFVEKLKRKMRN